MIPNFALSLSFEGLSLLRRMPEGWARLEDVALDVADLDAAMAELRATALSLDPKGDRVALILPNEQIRYVEERAPVGRPEDAARAAIDGATPYTLDELAIDHSLRAGQLKVAAVAHETLREAEAFAISHDFVPVSFMAVAPPGKFHGAVFFGAAKGWTGRRATRPGIALRIVPPSRAARKPVDPGKDKSAARPAAAPEAARPMSSEPKPGAAAALARHEAVRPPDRAGVAAPRPAMPVAAQSTRGESPDGAGRVAATAGATAPAAAAAPRIDTPDPAPTRKVFRPLAQRPAPRGTAQAAPSRGGAEARRAPTEGAGPAFSSARAGDSRAPLTPPASPPRIRPRITPVASAPPAGAEDADEAGAGRMTRADPAPTPRAAPFGPAARGAGAAIPAAAPPGGASDASSGTAADTGATAEDRTPTTAERLRALRERSAETNRKLRDNVSTLVERLKPEDDDTPEIVLTERTERPPLRGPFQKTDEELQRMTRFGERGHGDRAFGARTVGLALTAALIAALVGVGAWSLLVRGDAVDTPVIAALPDPQTPSDAPAPSQPEPAANADAAPETPSTATGTEETPQAAPPPAEQDAPTELAALPESEPAAVPPEAPAPPPGTPDPLAAPIPDRPLDPQEAAATYAATGIWLRAPREPARPPLGEVDDIYVASIDPEVPKSDAVALSRPSAEPTDIALEDPGLPPPQGLTFDFDDRGLIRATPEGALSPDGLRIFRGSPPVVPPLRDEALPGPVTDAPPLSEFEGVRPQLRPEDLTALRERAILQGLTLDELASLRPVVRPRTLQEEAAVSAPDATEFAVAQSLIPVPRPRNMAAIVDAVQERRAAQAPAEDDTSGEVRTASLAAPAAPPRTVSPDIPTTAEVARAATISDAVNLNRIALFGVYGTEENRRALVRLANGDYQKVKVGDRLDGGQVVAIGPGELRYRKGGRVVTLDMPRG